MVAKLPDAVNELQWKTDCPTVVPSLENSQVPRSSQVNQSARPRSRLAELPGAVIIIGNQLSDPSSKLGKLPDAVNYKRESILRP